MLFTKQIDKYKEYKVYKKECTDFMHGQGIARLTSCPIFGMWSTLFNTETYTI